MQPKQSALLTFLLLFFLNKYEISCTREKCVGGMGRGRGLGKEYRRGDFGSHQDSKPKFAMIFIITSSALLPRLDRTGDILQHSKVEFTNNSDFFFVATRKHFMSVQVFWQAV